MHVAEYIEVEINTELKKEIYMIQIKFITVIKRIRNAKKKNWKKNMSFKLQLKIKDLVSQNEPKNSIHEGRLLSTFQQASRKASWKKKKYSEKSCFITSIGT